MECLQLSRTKAFNMDIFWRLTVVSEKQKIQHFANKLEIFRLDNEIRR